MTQKTVGFVGLGDMGLGMAGNLIKNGFPVIGYDLRDERMAMLEEAGGQRTGGCAEIGGKADAVFVMVPWRRRPMPRAFISSTRRSAAAWEARKAEP